MGRTLENQFRSFECDEIAQLYFTKGKPDSDRCKEFFCIPDVEVFQSIFTGRPAGFTVEITEQKKLSKEQSKDIPLETAIRKRGNRRPSIYAVRNLIWAMGKWESKELDCWLDKVQPDVIFFASGDYSFSYKVTSFIAQKRGISVVIGCYDDFYIGKRKTWNPLYHMVYAGLMRDTRKLFEKAKCFFGLSEIMTQDYQKLFGKTGHTMFVPAQPMLSKTAQREERMIYAGNLGHGRAEQLVLLGRAIKQLDRGNIRYIDVYSGEIRKELTSMMCEENGIRFHGKVSAEVLQDLMCTSKYVIHTESFEEEYKKRVKYSVSTKIADCLACGACILAFGPEDVASIEYLHRADAACVISRIDQLQEKLTELFGSEAVRKQWISNAQVLSQRNHNCDKNCKAFKEIIFSYANEAQ